MIIQTKTGVCKLVKCASNGRFFFHFNRSVIRIRLLELLTRLRHLVFSSICARMVKSHAIVRSSLALIKTDFYDWKSAVNSESVQWRIRQYPFITVRRHPYANCAKSRGSRRLMPAWAKTNPSGNNRQVSHLVPPLGTYLQDAYADLATDSGKSLSLPG